VIVMGALPALLAEIRAPQVSRLVIAAARELPPDDETPDGVARRALLVRAVLVLLEAGTAVPSGEALRAAADILDVVQLPPGSPERRVLEERVWELGERGRASAPLRALADKLGFSRRDAALETVAS